MMKIKMYASGVSTHEIANIIEKLYFACSYDVLQDMFTERYS